MSSTRPSDYGFRGFLIVPTYIRHIHLYINTSVDAPPTIHCQRIDPHAVLMLKVSCTHIHKICSLVCVYALTRGIRMNLPRRKHAAMIYIWHDAVVFLWLCCRARGFEEKSSWKLNSDNLPRPRENPPTKSLYIVYSSLFSVGPFFTRAFQPFIWLLVFAPEPTRPTYIYKNCVYIYTIAHSGNVRLHQ